MANLKELRNRIASVSSTMQITSAMKMVSAAKLKKAQDAVTQMRPYAVKLNAVLSNVSATLDASEPRIVRRFQHERVQGNPRINRFVRGSGCSSRGLGRGQESERAFSQVGFGDV